MLITVQAVAGETYYFKEGRSFGSIIPLPGVTYASQIDKVNLLGRDQAESELTTYGYQKPEVQSVD
ncbi:MAG: hypothetical protein CFE46_06265 [Burkholderiales bacterium PBB6]|nr:MAG: hypothetical protein CFE46_06265 [Burkholderiales bacterium PBB6]